MVSVDLNITLVIQIVNFIVGLVVINLLIISPVRGIIRQRRELSDKLTKDAGKFANEASLRLNRYESELETARAQAAGQREVVKAQAQETGRSILEGAQSEAGLFLQRSRKEVEQEVETLRRALRGKIGVLADKAVSRIME
ncbi:MAG: ATP synthase F0 subunit B [Desulfovibrionaceae bacterium]|nr:ATP synthase F0 subunit B [Desulfovibrionaceae bacterium]